MEKAKKYKVWINIVIIIMLIIGPFIKVNYTYKEKVKTLSHNVKINNKETDNSHYINIIFSTSNSFANNIIRVMSNSKYSHISLALDNDFSRVYSYVGYQDVKANCKKTGFNCRDINDFPKETICTVITYKISDKDYYKIKDFISRLENKDTQYNYLSMFLIIFNIKTNTINDKYICCTFVSKTLSILDDKILKKDYRLYTIKDLYELLNNKKGIKKIEFIT